MKKTPDTLKTESGLAAPVPELTQEIAGLKKQVSLLSDSLAQAQRELVRAKEINESVHMERELQLRRANHAESALTAATQELEGLRAALVEKTIEADTMRQHHANAEALLAARTKETPRHE